MKFKNLSISFFKLGILGILLSSQYIAPVDGKIAQNHLGFQLGYGELSMLYANSEVPPVTYDNDADGFAFSLEGNFNAYNPENQQYGLDIPLSYLSISTESSGPDSNGNPVTSDFDVDLFQILLRPYYQFDNFIMFLDLGLNYLTIEGDLMYGGGDIPVGKSGKASFSGGFGFEFVFSESFSISPYVGWSESEMCSLTQGGTQYNFADVDVFAISVPLTYSLNEKYDVTFSYTFSDFDRSRVTNGAVGSPDSLDIEATFISLGLGYKF